MVVGELAVVELLVHVDVREEVVEEVEEQQVGEVDYEQQLEDGVALLQDRRLLLLEPQERFDYLHNNK